MQMRPNDTSKAPPPHAGKRAWPGQLAAHNGQSRVHGVGGVLGFPHRSSAEGWCMAAREWPEKVEGLPQLAPGAFGGRVSYPL